LASTWSGQLQHEKLKGRLHYRNDLRLQKD
jgi:hypothetical protein